MAAKTVKGILRGAKRIVTTKGWVQGEMTDEQSGKSFCARGALALAAGAKIEHTTYDAWDADKQKYVKAHEYWMDEAAVLYEYRERYNPAYQQAVDLCDRVARERAEKDPELSRFNVCTLIGYNDWGGRTVDDIVSLFDEAIKRAA